MQTLKALGLGALLFAIAMVSLWGLLLIAKGYEDRAVECTAKGGEMLYNRCIDTIKLGRT